MPKIVETLPLISVQDAAAFPTLIRLDSTVITAAATITTARQLQARALARTRLAPMITVVAPDTPVDRGQAQKFVPKNLRTAIGFPVDMVDLARPEEVGET